VRCRSCGLVQEHPRDNPATLARVYDGLADGVYDSEDGNRRVDADQHLALVQAHHTAPAPLLDVGCATGLFAARAQAVGYQASRVDASRWAIERARAGVRRRI